MEYKSFSSLVMMGRNLSILHLGSLVYFSSYIHYAFFFVRSSITNLSLSPAH